MKEIDFDVHLALNTELPLVSSGEYESHWAISYYGDILGRYDDGSTGQSTDFKIGEIEFKNIQLDRRYATRDSILEVIDVTQELHENCISLIDPNEDALYTGLFPNGDLIVEQNILMISEVAILPRFRGQKIGLGVIRNVIERFSTGCGVVILKAFPLQLTVAERQKERLKAYELDTLSQDSKSSTSKLERYYAQLGFKKLKNSKLMIADPNREFPSLEELGINEFGEFRAKI